MNIIKVQRNAGMSWWDIAKASVGDFISFGMRAVFMRFLRTQHLYWGMSKSPFRPAYEWFYAGRDINALQDAGFYED